jgi:hypothetical protein
LIEAVPSPKFQPQVRAPVPPDAVVASATALPTSVGLGEAVGVVTDGAAFTVTVTLLEALPPTASVAVTVAVNDPAAV